MNLWSMYVLRLLLTSDAATEAEFLEPLTVQQGTFNRWKNGKSVPTSAAAVAEFARELGRNPLEAFVAAGMLELDEAGRGLGTDEREFLRRVRDLANSSNPGDVLYIARRDKRAAKTAVIGKVSEEEFKIEDLYDEPSAAHPLPRNDVEGDVDPDLQ